VQRFDVIAIAIVGRAPMTQERIDHLLLAEVWLAAQLQLELTIRHRARRLVQRFDGLTTTIAEYDGLLSVRWLRS
tara:strand:+ start:2189 stop:2413 length:225 start_codon:yes stop_codon:yes gene_type:complete